MLDINGNFEKGKAFAGAIGGQLLQFCIVLQALSKMNQGPAPAEGDEAAAQKKTPKDVVDSPNLVTFLLAMMKDLKNESGILI